MRGEKGTSINLEKRYKILNEKPILCILENLYEGTFGNGKLKIRIGLNNFFSRFIDTI